MSKILKIRNRLYEIYVLGLSGYEHIKLAFKKFFFSDFFMAIQKKHLHLPLRKMQLNNSIVLLPFLTIQLNNSIT